MQASGLRLERVVANTLMAALGKCGLVEEVAGVFRRMVWGPARLRACGTGKCRADCTKHT